MYTKPNKSPWGDIDWCETLCPGVFMVATPSHGGIMVSKDMTAVLSPAARKCGLRANNHLCFEEDGDEHIVLRELLDKKLWDIPARIKDRAAFEENINDAVRRYHPEYWRTRRVGLENHPARQTVSAPAHEAEL